MRGGRLGWWRRDGGCRNGNDLSGAKIMEYLGRMQGRVNLRIDFQNAPIFANDVGDAPVQSEDWDPIFGTIGFRDPFVRIEQQRKRQVMLSGERAMRFGAVYTATEKRDSAALKFCIAVAECARFFSTSGCVVLRIKVEDHRAA